MIDASTNDSAANFTQRNVNRSPIILTFNFGSFQIVLLETDRLTFKKTVGFFHAQNMSKFSEDGGVMILLLEGNVASLVWDLNYIFNFQSYFGFKRL